MKDNLKIEQIVWLKVADMVLHKITETHPRYTHEQFRALVLDINEDGQKVAVDVYRGKIVDGRHRYMALVELGIEYIKCCILANNSTLDSLARSVNSSEVRRHQSPTQLAIKAHKLYIGGLKQPEAIARVGCSITNLKHIVRLVKLGRQDIIDSLEEGGKIDVSTDSRYSKMTDSLTAIVAFTLAAQECAKDKTDEYYNEGTPKLSSAEYSMIDGVALVTASWNEMMTKNLIARLYKNLEGDR